MSKVRMAWGIGVLGCFHSAPLGWHNVRYSDEHDGGKLGHATQNLGLPNHKFLLAVMTDQIFVYLMWWFIVLWSACFFHIDISV